MEGPFESDNSPRLRSCHGVQCSLQSYRRWTALGVVDADIASARSVIEWGGELQNTVDYVIVHNHFQDGVASSWENPKLEPDVTAFRETFWRTDRQNPCSCWPPSLHSRGG